MSLKHYVVSYVIIRPSQYHFKYDRKVSTKYIVVQRASITEQVASNKSNLLLKILMQNTQTVQLFTEIIKTESIYKSN